MKTKRTLSLVLSIMMIVSSLLLPANAFANDYVTGYDEVKNPLIQDTCDENYVQAKTVFSSGAASYSSDVVYSNPIQAAEALRDGLVKRQNPIKVEFYYTKDFDDSSTTGVAIFSKLFNMAISEDISVSSVDGDYLRWSWGGYGVNHAYKDMGDGKIYGSLTYDISYYTTAEEESILTDKINADIGALNLNGKSEYLKVKTIHDYLCESIKYDYVNLNNKEYKYKFSGYGSLVLGYGVCQGYSALFTRICEENGLVSRIIVGQNHAWNIVKVGDKFYNVDVTWDDTHYDTPSDPNGNYWSDNYYHKWMLKGSEDFDQHITVDEFSTKEFWASYPLAKTAYVCNHENSHIVIPDTADCTKGFQTHQYCENCGLDFDQKIIPANSKHIITTSVVEPTCTEQGYTNQKCSRCKYENKVDYVEAKNHTIVVQDAVEPTCTQTGLTQGSFCSICNEVFAVQEEIPAKGHTVVVDEGVAPTCTTPGNIIKSHCSVCNIEFGETGYIPALGHNYDSVVTPPTCTEQGYTTHTCSRCGVFYVDNYRDELGHAVVKDEAVVPTCENTGLTEGSHCSVCHIEITKQSVIPPLGHNYDSVVTPPTCTEQGYTTHTCSRCGVFYVDNYIQAIGHEYISSVKAPTCTEQGYTTYTCIRCNNKYNVDYVKPKTHSNVAKVTKATISKDGKIEYTCTVCKRKYSTSIPKASNIKLSATSYTYDGKVKTPSVTVKDSKGKTLRKNTDYTVSYASGRKNVGKYAVKITFKGNYSGSKTLYFTINPKGTSISKITAAKKGFKVFWKKQSTQTTGYQIQYSTSSKFSNAKTVTLTKNSYTSKSISKLSAKKKYYVRVRTYKKVGSTYYYSYWSKAKYVTTKK